MEKFNELLKLYENTKVLMSAICVAKGGLDIDNYIGRFFSADLLEFLIEIGQRVGADKGVIEKLKDELDLKKDLLTPQVKPVYQMTLEEFERMIL